ncbi:hypothetical protein PV327_008149 [Microctonus hyperodae]|uniref:BTB domain-containing protein n=1 Tax=Microctonus hyperodae TaxID=165561 RepID=A0AA39F2J3_MICHY|nr:hypothetical protein PV327_008149 [Microctonus hyperodae]
MADQQPDLRFYDSWKLQYETCPFPKVNMYSRTLVNELLPDVKFSIFCGLYGSNKYKVILAKKPCRPANATVRIELRYSNKLHQIQDYLWIDDGILECDFFVNDDPRCPKCKNNNNSHYITFYTFKCYITWGGFNAPQQSVSYDLYSGLKNFLTVPDLSDIMIVIDEKEILLHKIILAAYSPVFLAMFKSGMTESSNKRIVVTDIEVEIMEKVVEFMYTGTINPIPEYDILLSIMKVADKYEILGLKEFSERKLSQKITLENVFEIFEKNRLYGGPLLKKNVIYFMVNNKISIIRSKNFNDFCRRKPELLSRFLIHSIAHI